MSELINIPPMQETDEPLNVLESTWWITLRNFVLSTQNRNGPNALI